MISATSTGSLVLAPAIIVGDHADQGVGKLGLAGELGLGHRGHADHVAAPRAVELALGAGRELRPFHRQIEPPRVTCAPAASAASAASADSRGQTGSAIETWATRPGPKKLASRAKVRSMNWSTTTKRPGAQLLAQRPDRRDGDEVGAAGPLQRVDIGAGVDLRPAGSDGRGRGAAGRRTSRLRSGRSAIRPTAPPRACRPRSIARPRARRSRRGRSRR